MKYCNNIKVGCEGIKPPRHPPDIFFSANGFTVRRQEHSPLSSRVVKEQTVPMVGFEPTRP